MGSRKFLMQAVQLFKIFAMKVGMIFFSTTGRGCRQ
jgi:hypothetical protein